MKISNKIVGIYILISVIMGVLFYPILPRILNYPPDSINNEFQSNIDLGLSYTLQFIIIITIGLITGIIVLKLLLRKIDKLQENSKEDLNNTVNKKQFYKLFNLPTKIYIVEIIIPLLLVIILYAISELKIDIGTIKIGIIIATFETLVSLILYIYCNNQIRNTFIKLNIFDIPNNKNTSLRKKMLSILLPIIFVALVMTAFIGYMRIIEEKGAQIHKYYKNILNQNFTNDKYTKTQVKEILNKIEIDKGQTQFIIYNNGAYTTFDNSKLSNFFVKYTIEKSVLQDGRTFDTYAVDTLGTAVKIEVEGNVTYVGIKYPIYSLTTLVYLAINLIILMVTNTIILYYYSKSLAKDIVYVSNSMLKIANEKNIEGDKKIPVSSNDEIGELSIAFNKVRDKTNEYISQIESDQEVLTKQAQLVTLGELAGGMAHDINTPISAIKTSISYLNRKLQNPDEREVLENMQVCTEKIISMVNSMRNQIRNLGASDKQEIIVRKVIKDTEIIVRNELVRTGCNINVDCNDDIVVFGESNKLGQVITNIVMNSIQAYEGNKTKGDIDIVVVNTGKEIIIKIEDKAGGVPDGIKDYIFKNILTTKGVSGTGIGLYLCYSVIKGSFGGDIILNTTTGVGTIFEIKIPNKEVI